MGEKWQSAWCIGTSLVDIHERSSDKADNAAGVAVLIRSLSTRYWMEIEVSHDLHRQIRKIQRPPYYARQYIDAATLMANLHLDAMKIPAASLACIRRNMRGTAILAYLLAKSRIFFIFAAFQLVALRGQTAVGYPPLHF